MTNPHHSFINADSGIIIAADVPTLDHLSALIEAARSVNVVVAIKVGFSLALRYGLSYVVKTVCDHSELPVIYDHQKAGTDIPAMGRPFAEVCQDAGVKGVIVFPLAGPKTLEAFVAAAFDCNLTPIVGLVMTHSTFLKSDGGFIADEAAGLICSSALNAGVRNFVMPGTKPEIVRSFCEGPLAAIRPATIMMPGIGSQGGSLAVAFEAAKNHRPFAIIGSAIYQAPDPKAAIERFAADMRV